MTVGSSDENLFEDEVFHHMAPTKLKVEEGDVLGPYSLIIFNDILLNT